MFVRRHGFVLIKALMAIALAVLLASRGQRAPEQQTSSYRCCTSRQILDRAVRLSRVLDPRAGLLELSAEHTPEGYYPPVWRVEAIDEASNKMLRLTWDANTGDLWSVSVSLLHEWKSVRVAGRAPTAREVVRVTGGWIRDLEFAGQSSQWRLACAPDLYRGTWWVTWKAEGRQAVVQVDASTGELLGARGWQTGVH